MSKAVDEKLENLILKYELALQACERALYEAASNENCGFRSEYLTDQEQAEAEAKDFAEQVRNEAKGLGIELPEYKEKPFERVKRQTREERMAYFTPFDI